METISQVGHDQNGRSQSAGPHRTPRGEGKAARSLWFDDPQAKEIGASPGSKGTVGGWLYVRTKTGHLKKRFNNRDSVP
jgi:hypothetical protein